MINLYWSNTGTGKVAINIIGCERNSRRTRLSETVNANVIYLSEILKKKQNLKVFQKRGFMLVCI